MAYKFTPVVSQYPILFQELYILASGVTVSFFCFKTCILTPMVSQYPILFQDFYINAGGVTVSFFVSGLLY